jgi:cytoskeletal protein CcmA (bactofilin family)
VHGSIEGVIVVRDLLDMRANGSVVGELTYGRLAVVDGGHIAGVLQRNDGVPPNRTGSGNVISLNDALSRDGDST